MEFQWVQYLFICNIPMNPVWGIWISLHTAIKRCFLRYSIFLHFWKFYILKIYLYIHSPWISQAVTSWAYVWTLLSDSQWLYTPHSSTSLNLGWFYALPSSKQLRNTISQKPLIVHRWPSDIEDFTSLVTDIKWEFLHAHIWTSTLSPGVITCACGERNLKLV